MARVTQRKLWTSILGVFILAAALVAGYNHHAQAGKASHVAKGRVSLDKAKNIVGSMPLAFEPNQGQTDSQVQFLARSAGYQVFLTSGSSATFEYQGAGNKVHVVTMNLAGTKETAKAKPQDKLRGVSNYYLGQKKIEGIPNYGQVRYNDLYPGVAVVYQGDNLRFRYDFEVAPGADPKAIRWSYDGADNLSVGQDGALVVATSDGDQVASSKPYIYQDYGGTKHEVEGGYRIDGKNVSFEVARYDATKPLVIDPSFSNGTLLGATGVQVGDTVLNAVANNGTDIYVTGYTLSANYPTKSAAQGAPGGNTDVVVTELTYAMNAGNNPVFSTYIGGSGPESGNGIALDGSGNAIVVGTTQSGVGFPSVKPLLANSPPLRQNAFVVKLSAGGTLLNASQLWGTGATVGNSVAVQSGTGNIAITGSTTAADFINVIGAAGAFQATNNSTLPGPNAIFVDLSDSSSSVLGVVYGSYFGGTQTDIGNSVAWDPTTGDAVIGGQSTSFDGTPGGSLRQTVVGNTAPSSNLQITLAGTHGFVAKFDPTKTGATSLVFSQAIGNQAGSGFETVTAVAVDANGNNYIAGNVTETNPATELNFTSPLGGLDGSGTPGGSAQDGYVLEIGPSGGYTGATQNFVYGTLVTGDEVNGNTNAATIPNAVTNVTGLAVDALGQAYVSGFVNNSITAVNTSYAIRRRINAGGFIVGVTPFLTDFVTTVPSQAGAVTAVGDVILTSGTLPQSPFGAFNGISYDPTSANVCVAGYINQKVLPTAGTLAIIQSSALQPSGPAVPIKTGLVVCNQFNSDTTITSSSFSAPNTFLFTQVDGSNTSTPTSETFSAVNNDPAVTLSDFTISPLAGDGQIINTAYTPATTAALRWLHFVKNGSQVTMTINTAIAGTFDPGLYSVTFLVTPTVGEGDNGGVPQTITVQLSVTGTLDEDTIFGGGTLLSQEGGSGATGLPSYGSSVTCVDATLTCTLSITEGANAFSDGNTTERFTVPLVSIIQHFNPSKGNIEFTESKTKGTGNMDFISVNDTSSGPNNAPGCSTTPVPGTATATANACVVTVSINAATFSGIPAQSYSETLNINVGGTTPAPPVGVIAGATESTTQVSNPGSVTFVVVVSKGSLIFGGGSTIFSAPAGANPFVLQQNHTYLDSISLGTSTVTTFSTAVTQASSANPISCGGGVSASLPFPAGVLTLNLSGPLQASNNGVVLNPGFSPTQTPESILVANPAAAPLPAGIYGENVDFIPSSGGAALGVNVPICLVIGNILTTTLESQEELNITTGTAGAPNGGDTVPFDIEAGSNFSTANAANDFPSLADIRVTALGSLTPIVGPPGALPNGVPVTVSIQSCAAPCFVTLEGPNNNNPNPWALPLVDTISVAPLLTTPAGHYPVVFQVVATAAANTINSALPTPETVTLDVNVTNGVGAFYWTSQFTDSNGVNNVIVASPTIPGAPASEAPGPVPPSNPNTPCTQPAGNTINLCFYSVLGTGVVTDGNGNSSDSISIMASERRARIPSLGSLDYNVVTGNAFLLLPRPVPSGSCAAITPTSSCTLTVGNFLNGIIASAPLGTYEEDFTINLVNGLIPNLPVPTPENVRVILNVVNYPTVTVTPASLGFNLTQAGSAPPAQTLTLTSTSAPATGIPFTATPTGSEVVLQENGTAVASIAGILLPGNAEVDAVTGNPITITVGINPAGLVAQQTAYTGNINFTIGTCTGQPASCVATNVSDPTVTVPIQVLVNGTPGLSICGNLGGAPANNCGTYNWTVGDPAAAPNTPTTINIQLISSGSETYTVTSDQPWAVVSAPSPNNSAAQSTVTVTPNLAVAPTAPGTYMANIKVAGNTGAEPAAVTQITLIVAGPPSLTLTPPTGTGNAAGTGTAGTVATPGTPGAATLEVDYNYGAANPAAINVAESVTNTPDNPTLPLTYSAVTYSAGASGWLALTTAPATVNNTGATLVLTVNPTTPQPIAPGVYTATFTTTETDGNVPATYTAAVTTKVTLKVIGSLTATAANNLFTYVMGTASADLPLVIASQPAGVTFNITTSTNLASSIQTGTTPSTPQITVNGANVTTPGQAPGTITISVDNTLLNCPATQVTNGLCSVQVPFSLNIHSNFFTGESLISGGGGFYTLGFFGTYAYFPSQLAIYHTTLGIELLFTNTDATHGIYMYDSDSGHIWYTNPADYPNVYDFSLGTWLFYETATGNGTAGSRQFYNYTTKTFIFE